VCGGGLCVRVCMEGVCVLCMLACVCVRACVWVCVCEQEHLDESFIAMEAQNAGSLHK